LVAELPSGGQDDFSARPRDHFHEFADVDTGTHERHVAVREQDVGPARVKAVDVLVVAVDGTPARRRGPVEGKTLDDETVFERGPGAAQDLVAARNLSARDIRLRLAGLFPEQDR